MFDGDHHDYPNVIPDVAAWDLASYDLLHCQLGYMSARLYFSMHIPILSIVFVQLLIK